MILDRIYEIGGITAPVTEGEFTVQRGFIRLGLKAPIKGYINGVGFIDYSVIRAVYQNRVDSILNELQIIYAQQHTGHTLTADVRDVSFLSYGYTPINYICLLLDCFSLSSNTSNQAAILELANNILSEMPVESALELRDALMQKYGIGYKNALYEQVLYICDKEVQ